jgi:hypothetical protein
MTADELRHEIKMDAQTCEELTVSLYGAGSDLSDAELEELIQRATRLLQNARLYRDSRMRRESRTTHD